MALFRAEYFLLAINLHINDATFHFIIIFGVIVIIIISFARKTALTMTTTSVFWCQARTARLSSVQIKYCVIAFPRTLWWVCSCIVNATRYTVAEVCVCVDESSRSESLLSPVRLVDLTHQQQWFNSIPVCCLHFGLFKIKSMTIQTDYAIFHNKPIEADGLLWFSPCRRLLLTIFCCTPSAFRPTRRSSKHGTRQLDGVTIL